MTIFGTLTKDRKLVNVREIKQEDMLKCPFCIMLAEHYREDGSCRCNDPEHRKMMMKEWGYKKADFREAGIPMD